MAQAAAWQFTWHDPDGWHVQITPAIQVTVFDNTLTSHEDFVTLGLLGACIADQIC